MSYNYIHYDNLFTKMRQTLPKNYLFYYLIVIIKLLPLFLQAHTPGFPQELVSNVTLQKYFKYFSLSYYLQNSFSTSSILFISALVLFINIMHIIGLVLYLLKARKIKKLDDNFLDRNSNDFLFHLFSNLVFFKYILLSQFFFELDFLPLFCVESIRDTEKFTKYNIFSREIDFSSVCEGNRLVYFTLFSALNFTIDISYNILLTSRFFDFNILSDYFWNCFPSPFYSFLFLESFSQVFFVMFLNFKNETYKLIFGLYVYMLFVLNIYRYFKKNDFYSISIKKIMTLVDYVRTMVIIAQILIQIFTLGVKEIPSDINIAIIILVEIVFSYLKHSYLHKDNFNYVSSILFGNLNKLNEKNIYFSLYYLMTEFRVFSDVNYKFDDKNLDLFLENYVNHLKICEDFKCPCKNYIKKISNASNTIKEGYTTVINFSHMGNDNINREEYILNKFFNVLSANVSSTIKYTNCNINLNNINDNNKQKIIYNLRLRLISAVKKLISYRLEILFINLEGMYASNFTTASKNFIRVNFFSLHLLCYKSYYKTFFLFHEFLSDFYKRHGRRFRMYMIYYHYLKSYGLKEYNDHLTSLKSTKKDSSNFMNVDFRDVLSQCTKFYDIEKKLLEIVNEYKDFLIYFERTDIKLDTLLKSVKDFQSRYKNLTDYIRYFFKNDKINNLFVSSKIILLYKILQFEIPENLHNKLIVQINDNDGNSLTRCYADTNYYIITHYVEGQFLIKFISHELLIVLEYSQDELKDQDFNILLPEKMRSIHSQILINEIKNKNNLTKNTYKEVFLVGKRRTCILFDITYKVLVNDNGEITFLSMFNLKKIKNDYKTCFACIDDLGEVLAVNKEFEEYMICSMKVLDYVKIDAEKIILQNNSNRIKEFFKDDENNGSEFFDKFDYELYLNSLFGEEFEVLRDKNETLYKKKLHRWEGLKEIVKKGRYYNRFIDIYVRLRMIGIHKIFYVRFLIKGNMIIKSITEPYNTTLSLINAVKISKREMAKLSFYKLDEIYEPKSDATQEEDEDDSHDFLNESQSILSSAAMILKERNSKRIFKTGKSKMKFLPKSRNILYLIIFLLAMSLCSIIYTIISMLIKWSYFNRIDEVYNLNMNVVFLRNSIQYLNLGILNIPQITENLSPYDNVDSDNNYYVNNTIHMINENIHMTTETIYYINLMNNIYFNNKLNNLLSMVNNEFMFVFENGLIYKKGNDTVNSVINSNVYPFKEIQNFAVWSSKFLDNYIAYKQDIKIHFKDYFILNKLKAIQKSLPSNISLSEDNLFVFYVLENFFPQINPYMNTISDYYKNYFISELSKVKIGMIILKFMELFILLLIVFVEIFFIKLGFEKAKRKMRTLKEKVKSNNLEVTINKIAEFTKFCNTFNIFSLYNIADFEFNHKKIEEKEKEKVNKKKLNLSTKEASDMNFTKNLNQSSPNRNLNEGSTISSNEEKGIINKSLMKLENIKKQKMGAVYIKNDSNSFKTDNLVSNLEMNVSEVPQELKENENFKVCEDFSNKERVLRHVPTVDDSKLVTNPQGNNEDVYKKSSSFTSIESHSIEHSKIFPKKKGVLRAESFTRRKSFVTSQNETKNEESNQFLINENDPSPVNLLEKLSNSTKRITFAGAIKKFYSPDMEINDNQFNNQKKALQKIHRKVESYLRSDRELPLIVEKNMNEEKSFKNVKISSKFLDVKEEALNDDYKIPLTKSDNDLKDPRTKESLTDKNNQNVTLKKKQTEIELKESQQQEIGEQIERIAYSNKGPKLALSLFVFGFFILYLISILFYFQTAKRLLSLHSFSYTHLDKIQILNEILLKYEINLIHGFTQEDVSSLFEKIADNSKEIISMRFNKDYSYLTQTNLLESSTQDSNACKYLSERYSIVFNTDINQEFIECSEIGEKININGLDDSFSNILNTMRLLFDDLNRLGSISENQLVSKLKDKTYYNIDEAVEFTFYKFYKLLKYSIIRDMNTFFSSVKETDSILSYFSIIINILFALFSLIFVILPIKSVEIIISWILNKLVKNKDTNLDK